MFKQLTLNKALHNRFNLPDFFLWPVLMLCIIPAAYVLAVYWPGTPMLPAASSGKLFFNAWLLFGIAASLIIGVLSIIDYAVKRDIATPLVGGLLLCTGFFNLLLFFTVNGVIFFETDLVKNLDFVWFFGHSFHAIIITLTTGFFVWSGRTKTWSFEQRNYRLRWASAGYTVLALAAAALYLSESFMPVLKREYSFFTHPFELLNILIYLFWGFFILPRFLKRFPSSFSRMLILSVIPLVFGQLFMAIYQGPFDILFNLAYFYHFIALLVPLAGICMNYIETSRKEKKIISRLKNEMRERIEAQHNLQKREALLTHAEEIARLGSWELDTSTAEIKWSDELYNIFGYDKQTVKPSLKLQEEIIEPAYREKVRRALASAVRNKTSFSIEYEIRRPDGQKRYLLGKGNCFKDNRLIGTLLDISELKEANLKLQYNEALLREAEAISNNGSWEYIIASGSLYCSDELYRIHGILPGSENITIGFYHSFIHPDNLQQFKEKTQNAVARKESVKLEYKIIRPNGEVRYVFMSGKVKTDEYGKLVKLIGNVQDITELKNTVLELDKSESIYRTIAKNVPDSIVFLFDKAFNLLLTEGPIAVRIQKEITDKSLSILKYLLTEKDKQKFEEYFNESLQGKELHYESRLKGRHYKINFMPVYNSHQEIFGVMAVMHDISDLKQAQDDLENKMSELSRSNNELEQFAYVASHDLQEPLRKIRAFGERLKSKFQLQLPEQGQDYISRMTNASERMQLLIDDLLAFSRISRSTEEFKTLNLNEIIRSVISDLELAIDKKQARIEFNTPVLLKAIPSQMRQLFQNLISNSIKFTKEDTPPVVNITASQHKGSDLTHYPQLDSDKEYCVIDVQDNGIGFDFQYKEKIFVLFQRLHSRSEYEGTGIGLSVCKKIVDNHGGVITAEGREGRGALFTIVLPLESES